MHPVKLFICIILSLYIIGCNNEKEQEHQVVSNTVTPSDTAIINEQLRIAEETQPRVSDTTGVEKLKIIIDQCIKVGYNDMTCRLYKRIARYFADKGVLDSTYYYFKLAELYCNNPIYDKKLTADFLAEFGSLYYGLQSDMVTANQYYYEALKYLEDHNLTEDLSTLSIYLYLFYTQETLGNHEQALNYLLEAEKLAENLKLHHALISVRTNLGNYHTERENFKLAEKYFNQAVDSMEAFWLEEWDSNIQIAALVGKASVLTKMNESEKAVPYLKRAIQIAQERKILYSEVIAAIELGKTLNSLSRYNETIPLVTHALNLQGEFNWYKEEGYKVLMEAYEAISNFKNALEYQRKLYRFNDSIANTETKVALQELEVKYQTALKDKKLIEQKFLIEQQKSSLARKNVLLTVIMATALLILLIMIILYKNVTHKKKIKEHEINKLVAEQEINNLKFTMRGEEKERARLSRDLHDGIGSLIASSIMRLSNLKKNHPASVPTNELEEVLTLLNNTGSEVRKTAHNIMPDIIDKLPFSEAVKGFCDTISKGTSLSIDVQFYGDSEIVTSHCKYIIYRIIQELFHNIIKHSGATHAIIQCVINDDNFTLTVEDNGKGFKVHSSFKGMGLKNIEARVKSLSGSINIDSKPGEGTSVFIEFNCNILSKDLIN